MLLFKWWTCHGTSLLIIAAILVVALVFSLLRRFRPTSRAESFLSRRTPSACPTPEDGGPATMRPLTPVPDLCPVSRPRVSGESGSRVDRARSRSCIGPVGPASTAVLRLFAATPRRRRDATQEVFRKASLVGKLVSACTALPFIYRVAPHRLNERRTRVFRKTPACVARRLGVAQKPQAPAVDGRAPGPIQLSRSCRGPLDLPVPRHPGRRDGTTNPGLASTDASSQALHLPGGTAPKGAAGQKDSALPRRRKRPEQGEHQRYHQDRRDDQQRGPVGKSTT